MADGLLLDFGDTTPSPQPAPTQQPAVQPGQTPVSSPDFPVDQLFAAPAPAPSSPSAPVPSTPTEHPPEAEPQPANQATSQAPQQNTPDNQNNSAPTVAPASSSSSSSDAATTSATPPTTEVVTGSEEDEKPAFVPLDPLHKEIQDKFGGRWRLVRSDPYDEYLKAVGVGLFTRKIAGKSVPDLDFRVREKSIHISMRSTLHSQNYIFKLDEEVENLVEKARQGVFCSYKDGKLVQQMTPLDPGWGKVQEVEMSVKENGELLVCYTSGTAVCRRFFSKLPEVGISLPTMQPET